MADYKSKFTGEQIDELLSFLSSKFIKPEVAERIFSGGVTPEDIVYLNTLPNSVLYAKLPDGTIQEMNKIAGYADDSAVDFGITSFYARTDTEIRVSYSITTLAVVDGVVKVIMYGGDQSIEANKSTMP